MNIVETNLEFKPLSQRGATNYLIVHHVGDINRDVSAAEIHQWHLDNGWAGIGYHYVIRKDGTIERGRPRDTIGSHCFNHNWESVGINVVGDFMTDEPEKAQLDSLVELLKELKAIYPSAKVIGHRDMGDTECPGDNLYNKLGDFA